MKSLLRASVIAIALAGICSAQRGMGGGRGFRGGGFAGGARVGAGFGGRSFVGGYSSFGRGGWVRPRVFASYGHFGYRPYARPFWGYGYPGFGYASGFGYPYGYGLGYGYSGFYGGYAYAPSPNVTVIYPDYSERPSVPVVISNRYEPPAPAAGESDQPTLYLVAFKDGTIRAAIAYWVDGDMFHYVTVERAQKTAPLDQVDRGLSQRLNRERRVSFRLPGSDQYQPD